VELTDQLIPGVNPAIVRPLARRIGGQYQNVCLRTRLTSVEAGDDGLRVSFEEPSTPGSDMFDQILVAIGRVPSGRMIDAELRRRGGGTGTAGLCGGPGDALIINVPA
jgi:dihydrolipoamide dehydrogenase